MRRFKGLSILMAVAFITLLFAGAAFAATDNVVDSKPSYENDDKALLGDLLISELEDYGKTFKAGTSFKVQLPSGLKWDYSALKEDVNGDGKYDEKDIVEVSTIGSGTAGIPKVRKNSDTTLTIEFPSEASVPAGVYSPPTDARERLTIHFPVEFDSFDDGDIVVTIDDMDTAITPGEYVIGYASDGDGVVRVLDTETIGEESNAPLGTIEVQENTVDAFGQGKIAIKFNLPTDFTWSNTMDDKDVDGFFKYVTAYGGFDKSMIKAVKFDSNERDMYVCLDLGSKIRTQRGTIEVTPYVDVDSDADLGEIEINVVGDSIDEYDDADVNSTDIVIGTYADWDVKAYADDEIEELIAGENDQDLTTLKIDEAIKDSILDGRKLEIEFPDYVRIIKDPKLSGDDEILGSVSFDDDRSTVKYATQDKYTDAAEMEVDFTVSVAVDAPAGDLVATITGSAGVEGEVVLGKIVKPITVECDVKDIILGDQTQVISDIIIKEGKAEAIKEGDLKIELPQGVRFASTPDVEVTEGNLDVDEQDIDVDDSETTDTTDGMLTIGIDGESTKASTITISNVKLTADRTVPYGEIISKFKGTALAENYMDFDDIDGLGDKDGDGNNNTENDAETAGYFDDDVAVQAAIANLTTPAVENNGTFFIGSTVYTQNGNMKVMDVAPYIKGDRTYVPVRYLAYMLGIAEDDVQWDATTRTVTLTKGEDEVQLVIGSTTILVNGEAQTMDVAPEITNERTMLPARFVAEGFGYTVGWNPATQSVVIGK